jgi:hypothetical protein
VVRFDYRHSGSIHCILWILVVMNRMVKHDLTLYLWSMRLCATRVRVEDCNKYRNRSFFQQRRSPSQKKLTYESAHLLLQLVLRDISSVTYFVDTHS